MARDVTGCAAGVRGATKTNKMKSQDSKALWAPQTEKPIHYTYVVVIATVLNMAEWRTRQKVLICRASLIWLVSRRYLKEFRVEQCSLFLQHKCTQHRPFTCFHWHFLNQRRRRPIRRRDGTLNYSPDAYCNKFDENTGICPDGDEWVGVASLQPSTYLTCFFPQ